MDTAAGRCPRCGSALGPGRGGDVCAPCAFTFALDPAAAGAEPAPDRLGDFDIVREIGRGGMGIVYEAVQRSLDRRVALKVLHPWLGLGRSARDRFEREAQAAARLHHAHIVPVYATGEDGECLYYAMERVDGPSVAQALDGIRRGAFEAPGLFGGARAGTPGWYGAVARAIADVAEALAYAHGQGIVHRDIKPDNLLLARDGRLRLTDFGLARAAEDPGLTATGAWMGSPYYMSPEQVAAGRVRIDHRTDIYSLGVVLYELLTLERPVGGATRDQVLAAIVTEDPRPPRRIDPRVPADLESICLKALEKRPEERYADADAFARDLRQFARGGAIVARRAGPWRRAAKWARKHPAATTAAGAAMMLLAVGALAWQLSAARDAEREAHALTAARYALSAGDYRAGLARLRPHATRAGAPPEVRLVYARLLFGAGRGDEAVRQALGVLDLAPDDWAAHLVLATAGRYEGRIGQRAWKVAAGDHARAVERASPPVAEGAFLRAILEASDEDALGWLAQALDADPAHAGALEERTRRLMALGSLEDALASAERLVAVRPRSAEGHRLASQVHALAHAGDAAFAAIDRALRLDARDPRTYVDRGWLVYQRGDGRACVADAGRALALDPALPDALHLRGHCAWLLGDVDRAEADFHAAVELKPDFAEGYAALVMLAQQNTGRTADLAALVERLRAEVASSGDPEMRALALVIEAWARSAVGDHDGAAGLVDAALEHAPRGEIRLWALTSGTTFDHQRPGGNASACARLDGYVPANLSERLAQLQGLSLHCPPDLLFEAATRAMRAATGADPLFYRAKAALALRRTTVALEDLTRAIALAPGWPDPYEQRARVRLAIGDAAGALEDAERVAALVPGTGASLRAEALGRAGRLDEAVALLQQAIRDNPKDSGARVLCAELLAAGGRVEDGIEVLGPEASAGGAAGPAPPIGALLRLRAVLEARAGRCATGRARLLESTAGPEGQRRRAEALASRAFSTVFPVACPEHYDAGLALRLAGEGDAPLYAAARGFALHRRGRQAEAAAELERALAADPDDPLTLFFAARVAHDRGRRADALVFYDRAFGAAGPAPSTVVRTARDEAAAALGVSPTRP